MTEQENDSATRQEPIQEAMEEPLSRFDVIFWSSMISLVVMAIALSAYHFMLADKPPPELRLGVVDLVSITQKLNDDARQQASVVSLSDDQRVKIIAQYEQGLSKIEPGIKKLSQDCACVILVKATMPVVPDSVSDYTVALQNLVFSSDGLSKEAVSSQSLNTEPVSTEPLNKTTSTQEERQ